GDGSHARHQQEQELEALGGDLGKEKVDAGEISAGVIEAVNEADLHWVGALHEDDRDRAGRLLGRERGQRALERHDHRYLTADQFGYQAWQSIVVTFAPAVLEGDVLAIDEAGSGQPLVKIGQIAARLVLRR